MLARSVRSGLVETYHDGTVAVCDTDGSVLHSRGDIDRPFYMRSSAKPFQAAVSNRYASLEPLELAMACSSHRGHPVQVALAAATLSKAGLSADDLRCPADWPSPGAAGRLWRQGHDRPRRIWHNCSGKHAAFLSACVARGWPIDSYLDPDHPLQVEIVELVSDMSSYAVTPVGVDGCGAPVLRTTARAMATAFARLAAVPDLAPVYGAMHRYPALVSENGGGDSSIATAIDAVAKGGAQGCIGVALRQGIGLAVKSWDGIYDVAVVAAIAALTDAGLVAGYPVERLSDRARVPMMGGGGVVGHLEPVRETSP